MTEPLIHLDGVKKVFYTEDVETHALAGIHLDVMPGEYVSIAGPSGCGKTTLISIIAGILGYEEGVCSVFGNDFAQMSQRDKLAFRGENIGFIFQSFNLRNPTEESRVQSLWTS